MPTVRWFNSKYIGLKYSCGSPCWGTIILPINDKDSIIERMYDVEVDAYNNRLVYIGDENYDKIIVENFSTDKKNIVEHKFDSKGAFLGTFIESTRLTKNTLTINWVIRTNDGLEKRETEDFKLDL